MKTEIDSKKNLPTKIFPQILIVGAGAFGTALGLCIFQATPHGHITFLDRHEKRLEEAQCILPKVNAIEFVTFSDFATSTATYDLVILALPSQSLREVLQWLLQKTTFGKSWQAPSVPLPYFLSLAKGIETGSFKLPHQMIQEILGPCARVGCLSGPNFAKELREGKPSCSVIASSDAGFLKIVPSWLEAPHLRLYISSDILGVEVGGALKNVIALMTGTCDGLGLGDNARAAIITRGLSEIARVGQALGADPITFMGLSGVGDLLLTCVGDLSRNRTFGFRFAQGEPIEDILKELGTVEGLSTVKSAYELCQQRGLKATLLETAYRVLYESLALGIAIENLVGQKGEYKHEFYWVNT